MPSKYEKERAKAKKEAAKKKGGKKAEDPKPEVEETKSNGAAASNGASKEGTPSSGVPLTYEEELCMKLEEEARLDYTIFHFFGKSKDKDQMTMTKGQKRRQEIEFVH